MCLILFYFTLSSFKVIFKEPLPHPLLLHGDHRHGIRKRDDHTTPSVGTQATMPPSHPSLSSHTRCCHCLIRRHTSYVFFFSFLFVPFLTNLTETLFTPCAGSSNPHLSTVHCPSILASPATTIACIHRHAVKISFFFFSFFSFLF